MQLWIFSAFGEGIGYESSMRFRTAASRVAGASTISLIPVWVRRGSFNLLYSI